MSTVRPSVPVAPASQRVLCPYCGEVSTDPRRCEVCRGHFDPLSRQATQNAMGPWFIRDETSPFRPGCSIETLRDLIRRGKVTKETVIRGPGTKQFWNFAERTPSVANLLGICHNCRATVKPDDYSCKPCGAVFSPDPDRQHMGLAPVNMLPGEASPEIVAAASLETPGPAPVVPSAEKPMAAVVEPKPAARVEGPSMKAPLPERTVSYGPWLIAALVLVLAGMGAVFALVATNTVSIPWLTGGAVSPASSSTPPSPAQAVPAASPAPQTPAQPAIEASPVSPLPGATGEPGPSADPAPAAPATPKVDLDAILKPMLTADPFNEAAMLAKIEELRKEHPSLSKELDVWAAAAKDRAERLRLRGIP